MCNLGFFGKYVGKPRKLGVRGFAWSCQGRSYSCISLTSLIILHLSVILAWQGSRCGMRLPPSGNDFILHSGTSTAGTRFPFFSYLKTMQVKPIWHFVLDEKFIDDVIHDCEAVQPGIHRYVVVQDFVAPLKSIKQKEHVIFLTIAEAEQVLRAGKDIRLAIFHSLFSVHPYLVRITHPAIKVLSVIWGGEVSLGMMGESLFAPFTKELLPIIPEFQNWVGIDQRLALNPTEVYQSVCPHVREALLRSNFIGTIVPPEIHQLSRWLGVDVSSRFVRLNYGSVEDMLGQDLFRLPIDFERKARDILIGNSNAMTNNHIDVFVQLQHLKQEHSRWIVPLSYVEPPSYKSVVIQMGLRLGTNRFFPLLEFMDRNRYNQILVNCTSAIFRHHRQQAVGNVITALWLGSRVYLSQHSPVPEFMEQIGCEFFLVEQEQNVQAFCEPLPRAAMQQNRDALMAEYASCVVRERFRQVCLLAE